MNIAYPRPLLAGHEAIHIGNETLDFDDEKAWGEKSGTFCISVGAWAWMRVFGLWVSHGNKNNVEGPCFVSPKNVTYRN